MTAIELLSTIKKAEEMIQKRVSNAKSLRERLESPSMCYEEKIGCPGSRKLDGFASGLDKIMEYNDITEKYKADFVDLIVAVQTCIYSLDKTKEQKVLIALYVDLKSVSAAAVELEYSTRQLKRIRDEAIKSLDALLIENSQLSANVQKCPLIGIIF